MKYNTLNINIRIGSFIRKHRILLGMTGENLGQKLSLSQQHISRLERGQTAFSFELILHFLNTLDRSISDLIAEVLHEDSIYENLIIYQHESNTAFIPGN